MSFKLKLLAFTFAMAACAPAFGQQRKPVVVAVAPSSDTALLIVAVNGGFLEKQGLAPELKLFDSSPQALQALVGRQADVSMQTEPPQLGTRARGGKIVQVVTGWVSGRHAARQRIQLSPGHVPREAQPVARQGDHQVHGRAGPGRRPGAE